MTPGDLLYTKEHEWLRIDGEVGTIGITEHAQKELGEVVYVDAGYSTLGMAGLEA